MSLGQKTLYAVSQLAATSIPKPINLMNRVRMEKFPAFSFSLENST